MEKSQDTPVESTTTSLVSQVGNLPQPSGRDVAQASTEIVSELLKNSSDSQKMVVLMAILFGITENTLSSDVMWLSMSRAKEICQRLGIDEKVWRDTIAQYQEFANKLKAGNPMSCLF